MRRCTGAPWVSATLLALAEAPQFLSIFAVRVSTRFYRTAGEMGRDEAYRTRVAVVYDVVAGPSVRSER
jgi:hypothetical protein